MDNNMTAVVSAIMIGFGFLNGLAVASLLERGHSGKVQTMLATAMEKKFELEKQVREIQDALYEERRMQFNLVSKLRNLLRPYVYCPPSFDSDDEEEITSQDEILGNRD